MNPEMKKYLSENLRLFPQLFDKNNRDYFDEVSQNAALSVLGNLAPIKMSGKIKSLFTINY